MRNNYFKEHYNKNIAIPVGGVLLLALVLFFYVSMLPTNAVRNYQNSVSIPHSSVSQSNNLFESSTARFFQKYVSHVPPDSWQLVSGILRADWSNENSSADVSKTTSLSTASSITQQTQTNNSSTTIESQSYSNEPEISVELNGVNVHIPDDAKTHKTENSDGKNDLDVRVRNRNEDSNASMRIRIDTSP